MTRFPAIGRTSLLGENGALVLPSSLYTRARANPFFDYLLERLDELAEIDTSH